MCISEESQRVSEPSEDLDGEVKVVTRQKKGWSSFYITFEPIKFCVGFTMAFTSGVTIDLLERNVCFRKYNMSYTECTSSNVSTEIKADVEARTAEVNMINNVIQGICPLILVLFVGPWSDANGRKPFILWALRGYLVYYSLWALFSFFPHIPVIYFFIPSVPLGLTGGIISIYVCTWSYTCDNFQPEELTLRFTVSSGALICGQLLGNSLAEEMLLLGGEYGFQIVFIISFLISFLGLLYATFILQETIERKSKKTKLLDIEHVKSIINTVILNPKRGRLVITLVLIVLVSEIPAYAGDEAMAYLVGKSHFYWSLGRYNLFAALSSLISGVMPVLAIWLLMDKCGVSNITLLLLSSLIIVMLQAMKAMSADETMFWTTSLLIKSINIIGPCIDSELVDTVSDNNVGKAFTFTSLLDALSPLVAIPCYTQVYTALLPDKTIYVYFLTFALSCVTCIASLGLLFTKKRSAYSQPPEDGPLERESPPTENTPIRA